MRLRLFHKLFLMIALTALAAALAVAGVFWINLERGFSDLLDSRDAEQLDAFAQAVSAGIDDRGAADALRAGEIPLAELVNEMASQGELPGGLQRRRASLAPPPSGPSRPGPPPPGPSKPGPRHSGPPPRDPLPAAPPDRFDLRLLLFDAAGRQLAGPPPPRGGQPMREQVIRASGEVVGVVRLLPRHPNPGGVDARFLRSQYQSAVIVTLLLMVLAAIVAAWLARLGARRFTQLGTATTAIARGDFSARAAIGGDDEVAEVGRNIDTMAASLAQLDAARRRWLAEISHELRTPLAALIGELDALKDGIRKPDATAIRSLTEEAKRLNHIVQDLHFLAVSDLSGPSCEFVPTDALQLVERVAACFAATLQAAGLSLSVDADALTEMPVAWDPGRVEQLLTNLLSNSARYTDAPGQVRIRLSRSDGRVQLVVEDSAPPVPDDQLHRLFEPLFRDDLARARTAAGSGLGLAVCEAIVRAHGGRIAAAKSALGGVAVTVNLPVDGRSR